MPNGMTTRVHRRLTTSSKLRKVAAHSCIPLELGVGIRPQAFAYRVRTLCDRWERMSLQGRLAASVLSARSKRRARRFISSLNRAITFATSVKHHEGDPAMNFVDQLDPELRAVVEKLPTDRPLDLSKIPAARVKMNKMVTTLLAGLPSVEGVTSQDKFAPGSQ